MPADEDRFNRRPLRLEHLFAKLRAFYFVTFNTSTRAPMLARPEIHQLLARLVGKRMRNTMSLSGAT